VIHDMFCGDCLFIMFARNGIGLMNVLHNEHMIQ
jgi:hypothetical protein